MKPRTRTVLVLALFASGCPASASITDSNETQAVGTGTSTDDSETSDGGTGTSSTDTSSGETSDDESSGSETGGECGDGVLDVGEACDDGNNSNTDACLTTCLPASCGDGFVWEGEEACDDGLNDGSYDGCTADCMALGPFCGDGEVHGPEECDDGNGSIADGCTPACSIPRSCVDIRGYDENADTGVYTIDPDGPGGNLSYDVYCEMTIEGGGWQLVTVRHELGGVTFDDHICLTTNNNCTGKAPLAQVGETAPDVLVATLDGEYWLHFEGLGHPGSEGLADIMTLERGMIDDNTCQYPNSCNEALDPNLAIAAHSLNWEPRFLTLPSQWYDHGGLWFGNGGGNAWNHVFTFNYYHWCAPGVLELSDDSDDEWGQVVCGVPAALYFRQ